MNWFKSVQRNDEIGEFAQAVYQDQEAPQETRSVCVNCGIETILGTSSLCASCLSDCVVFIRRSNLLNPQWK